MNDDLIKKAKERTVKSQMIEYDLETLVKKINKGVIQLDPEYQRRHRWPQDYSSKLIESLILNIPIPIIYISQNFDADTETTDYRFSVIDGQQRLTAIRDFFNDEFELIELESLQELNGLKYSQLPPFLVRRLEERTIKCLRIDSTVDPQVKLDIFERLNSGSVKLEPQELRNASHQGRFNDLCKELSKNSTYQELLQITPAKSASNTKVKRMEDVELVLRFYALKDGKFKSYSQKSGYAFKDFLSDALEEGNKMEESELQSFKERFEWLVSFIHSSLGNTPFAKYKFENDEFVLQSRFNSAVYDSIVIGVNDTNINQITDENRDGLKELFKDLEYFEAVSGSTNNSSKVVTRINKVINIFS